MRIRTAFSILAYANLIEAEILGTKELVLDSFGRRPNARPVEQHNPTAAYPRQPSPYEDAQIQALGESILGSAGAQRQTQREREEVDPLIEQAEVQRRLIDAQERAKQAEFARKSQELRQISELVAADAQEAASRRRQFDSSLRYMDQAMNTKSDAPREPSLLLTQGPKLTEAELNAISLYPDTLENTDQNIPAWGLSEQARKLPVEGGGGGAAILGNSLPSSLDSSYALREVTLQLEKAQAHMQRHCSASEVENLGFLLLQAIREAAMGASL